MSAFSSEDPEPRDTEDLCVVDVKLASGSWLEHFADSELQLRRFIKGVVNSSLRFLGFVSGDCLEMAILLADNEGLMHLNSKFRQRDKPTGVLSFPCYQLTPYGPSFLEQLKKLSGHRMQNTDQVYFLGDIALSYEFIYQESIQQLKKIQDHIAHMVVHSVLHLLGYDHYKEEDALVMEKVEISILKRLGINNPYDLINAVSETK